MSAGATASVEWRIHENVPLTSASDRVETTTRNATVNGQPRTLHTLLIRDATTRDTAVYSCRSGTAADAVQVRVVRVASNQLLTC